MASPNPNKLSTVMPGAGTSFAVDGQTEIAANSIDDNNIVANGLTSASFAKNFLQLAVVTLTAADIIAGYGTAKQIVAAPGAGKAIVPIAASVEFDYPASGGAQFTGGGAGQLQFDSTNHAGGTALFTTLAAAVIQAAATSFTQLGALAANLTLAANKGVFWTNATAAFAAGNGTMTIYFLYQVI